jgi:hypothetical protein
LNDADRTSTIGSLPDGYPEKYFTTYLPDATDFFCSADHSMTPSRVLLALVLMIFAVVLVAGCTSTEDVSPQNGTASGAGPAIPTTGTMLQQYTPPLDHATALRLYRENLSPAQKKIPEAVLKVIDPAYPAGAENITALRESMIAMQQLLPAEQAAASWYSTTVVSGRPVGDQVQLVIHVNKSAFLESVNPRLALGGGKIYNTIFHNVVSWVDVQDLERLAAMDEVTSLELYITPQPKHGNQVTLYDISGFLKEWNEKMHWGYSDGQIDQFNRSLQNGLLKKYQGDSGLLSFNIPDMKTFCLEVGDAIGLTKNQSEHFAEAADDDLMQDKMDSLARSEYNTTGPGGPGHGS